VGGGYQNVKNTFRDRHILILTPTLLSPKARGARIRFKIIQKCLEITVAVLSKHGGSEGPKNRGSKKGDRFSCPRPSPGVPPTGRGGSGTHPGHLPPPPPWGGGQPPLQRSLYPTGMSLSQQTGKETGRGAFRGCFPCSGRGFSYSHSMMNE